MSKSPSGWIKKLLGALVALVIIALVVPFLIPVESYKAEIIGRVKAATGRDLTIGGPMRLTLLPHIGVHLEQVALSNPKGYSVPSMLNVQSATVHVALLPLLSGHAEVSKLVLEDPTINLEVNAQGVPNWRFTPPDQVPEAPVRHSERMELIPPAHADSAAHIVPANSGVLGVLQRIRLGDVEVRGGVLHYVSQQDRKSYTLEKIGLQISMNGPDAPFTLGGDAWFNGKPARVDMQLTTPQQLLSGDNAALKFSLTAEPVRASLTMRLSLLAGQGDADIRIPSLPGLSAWVSGTHAESEMGRPMALDIKGKLTCNMAQCSSDNTNAKLDDIALVGKLGLAWQNVARPYLTASMRTGTLDLTPYMATGQKGHAQNNRFPVIADAEAAAAATGWSEAPINVAALRSVDTDIRLGIGTLIASKFKAEQVSLSALLKDGVLNLNVPSATLYGGTGKADLTVDARAAAPAITTRVELHGVQAEQLLKDVAQFDRLSGKTEFLLNASGHGASQKAIVSDLNGNGKLSVSGGALKGVDLTQMQQGVQSILSGGGLGIGPNEKTKFSELGGTFTIAQGIVHNDDLAMTSDVVKMKGSGKVDLPLRYVNYRLEPAVAKNPRIAGKPNQLSMPPVIVEGPFEQVTFRPDVQALKDAFKNPETIKNTVNSVKDKLKSGHGGVKGLLQSLGH